MEIKQIIEEIRENINKRELNPLIKLENNSEKALKYSEILFRIKRHYNKEKLAFDKKYGEVLKKIKSSPYKPKNKQEVDSFIIEDDEYCELRKKIDELENIIEFLKNLIEIYKSKEATERIIFKYKSGEVL